MKILPVLFVVDDDLNNFFVDDDESNLDMKVKKVIKIPRTNEMKGIAKDSNIV